jgi:hypothetical protein
MSSSKKQRTFGTKGANVCAVCPSVLGLHHTFRQYPLVNQKSMNVQPIPTGHTNIHVLFVGEHLHGPPCERLVRKSKNFKNALPTVPSDPKV